MTRASFGALVTRLASSPTSLTERELLESSHWSVGEDARLREDARFRQTHWGRWVLAEGVVANDAVYRWFHAEKRGAAALDAALRHASQLYGRRSVFCPDDPRFVLRNGEVRLCASELSREPVVDPTVGDLEKYTTHLPLHSLKAAAASEPLGEWGTRAQEEVIETLGWVRVSLPRRRLNNRMFVAAIQGHSMDDGVSGLVDGAYAVFELWPSGTRQNLSVLVRGTFSDPETGSYAVKKYVADQRDEGGRHHRVSLVSLNQDKKRYPDIDLVPEQSGDVVVVAKVVQALAGDDYDRRPRFRRRIGRRNLTADEQAGRLARRMSSFFEGAAPEPDEEGDSGTRVSGWEARLVCLDVGAGGLQIEAGPLEGLPSFVKKLRIVGSDWGAIVLASNARTHAVRASVRPGTGPWCWDAVGFEDEEDLGLHQLALDALDVTAPTVFRVDANGVGQRIQSTKLATGQVYRLLLAPGVGHNLGAELDDGWRIWSLDLTGDLSPVTRQALTGLGLEVGEAWPRLEWALAPPSTWRTNPCGESYPVFEAGIDLLVNVEGVSVEEGDEVALFLHGPSGTERLPLLGNGLVSLGTPASGRWACVLMHSRTSVKSASLLFEVAKETLEHVAASWSAVAPGGLASLEVTAPPGWPVALRWRVLASHEEALATLYANEDSTLSLADAASVVEARAARSRIADLLVDAGELGQRTLEHDGRPSLKQVREQLTELWDQRRALVETRAGAWLHLMPVWFDPVAKLLGYGLEPVALSLDVEAPHDLAAWILTVDERMVGTIMRSHSRVLVLTTNLDAVLREHRDWVDKACQAAQVRDAIVTDGGRWTTHRRGSQQLKQQVWYLEHAIGLGSIDEMLGDLAEGL